MKYVPELEEEHFQSMVAVPMPARSGEVLGVVVLHTVAPREFDEGVLNFLVHTASLVAGAIENARLYEETRLRVDALTNLAELSEGIVAVSGREELYRVVTGGVRRLLACDAAQLWLRDGEDEPLELVAADPPGELPEPHVESRAPLRDDRRGGRRRSSPCARARSRFPAQHQELLQAVANQAALALRNAEHIERLTAENLVRALFEALDDGALDIAEARARAAGCDLDRPHVFVHARPVAHRRPGAAVARGGRARRDAAAHARGRRARRSRAARRCAACSRCRPGAQAGDVGALRELGAERGRRHRHERRAPRRRRAPPEPAPGPGRRRHRAGAARRAAARWPTTRSAPTATSCTSSLDEAPHDRLCEAIERLLAYDERRETQLLATLEQYLADRRVGTTHGAQALHPRQHAAPAPGPHPEADRARPRRRGPAVARARGQARAPSARRRRRIATQILSAT